MASMAIFAGPSVFSVEPAPELGFCRVRYDFGADGAIVVELFDRKRLVRPDEKPCGLQCVLLGFELFPIETHAEPVYVVMG